MVTAGANFYPKLTALDQYGNICSTGSNAYVGQVTFLAEDQANDNQDPELLTWTTQYYETDAGVKTLDRFTLKRAGENWLGAEDMNYPDIKVSPLATITVNPALPAVFNVAPLNDTNVGAGSNATPGRQLLTAILADSYDNIVPAAGVDAYFAVPTATGTMGSLQYQTCSTCTWYDIGTSTIIATDADGKVGAALTLAYKVSTRAGDSARVWIGTSTANTVPTYISRKQNISGDLITVGGNPSKLVFSSTPSSVYVGITEPVQLPAGGTKGGEYVVERLDDFDNSAYDYPNTVVAFSVVNHGSIGISSGPLRNFGFRNNLNDAYIQGITIYTGNSKSAKFRYHDRTASYSGVSPSSNTAESGRPGYWHLKAISGSMLPAEHLLSVSPLNIAKVTLTNPQRELTAGAITCSYSILNSPGCNGEPQAFKAELRDVFDNPTVATEAVRVNFSTITGRIPWPRTPSASPCPAPLRWPSSWPPR